MRASVVRTRNGAMNLRSVLVFWVSPTYIDKYVFGVLGSNPDQYFLRSAHNGIIGEFSI